jgi:hypothetical protein
MVRTMNLRRLATMTVAGLLTVPACAGHPVPAHGAGSRLSAGRPQDPAPQAIPVAAATLPARGTPPTGPVVFADLAGKWRGVMNEGTPGEVRSEIEVARLPSGDYVGRVSVPQQGVVLRATSVSASAGVLRFELKQVSGTFEGRLNAANTVAEGTWTQLGMGAQPLVLRRVLDATPAASARASEETVRPATKDEGRTPFTMPLTIRVHDAPTVLHGHGSAYLIYELEIVNVGHRDATLVALDVTADGRRLAHFDGRSLEDLLEQPGHDLLVRSQLVGGSLAHAFLWLPFDRTAELPKSIGHRVTVKVSGFAEEVSTEIAPVAVVPSEVVIDPPLRGGPWVVGNGPDNGAVHRRAFIPIAGVERLAQRFAIDFMRLDADGRSRRGAGTNNTDFPAYGEEVVAVADARVASVVDGLVENVPGSKPSLAITLATIAGNQVSLDLGHGLYAYYAHLQPGSLRVKAGDHVMRGQVLGRVGNSGNSSGPHLHFHVARGTTILDAEGVPFLYREYRRFPSNTGFALARDRADVVHREAPLQGDLVLFGR